MKTSNKLLLIFCLLIIALSLLTNIVLRANFKNKNYGYNPFRSEQERQRPVPKPPASLPAFKIIKLMANPGAEGIEIHHKDTYSAYNNDPWDTTGVNYYIKEDTLVLQLEPNKRIILNCPSFSIIILGDHGNANVYGFTLSSLTITGGKESGLLLDESQVGRLDVRGEKTNLMLQSATKIDTLNLVLGRGSELSAMDVPFQQVNMQLDSLAKFDIQGRSISAFRQIK